MFTNPIKKLARKKKNRSKETQSCYCVLTSVSSRHILKNEKTFKDVKLLFTFFVLISYTEFYIMIVDICGIILEDALNKQECFKKKARVFESG